MASPEERAELQIKIGSLKEELRDLEKDFQILVDAEENIAQLIATGNDTSSNANKIKVLYGYINEIRSNGNYVPGLDGLLDFSSIVSEAALISQYSDEYSSDIEGICTEIDGLKEEVSLKITAKKSELNAALTAYSI